MYEIYNIFLPTEVGRRSIASVYLKILFVPLLVNVEIKQKKNTNEIMFFRKVVFVGRANIYKTRLSRHIKIRKAGNRKSVSFHDPDKFSNP